MIEDENYFTFSVFLFMQNHWFWFDDLCVDDSQNFDVGDLITSLDNPERHGKAKVRLREGAKDENHLAIVLLWSIIKVHTCSFRCLAKARRQKLYV